MVMCASNILKSTLNGLLLARERGKILGDLVAAMADKPF
jgi:hypothetical protein